MENVRNKTSEKIRELDKATTIVKVRLISFESMLEVGRLISKIVVDETSKKNN